jgi:hypothetical protein
MAAIRRCYNSRCNSYNNCCKAQSDRSEGAELPQRRVE